MRIIAYSDGSFGDNTSAAASLILTEFEYLGLVVRKYKVRTPYEAELLAIIQVLEFINTEGYEYDRLTIYTDAKAVVNVFPTLKKTGKVPSNVKSKSKWNRILELMEEKKVFIFHQPGHQDLHNPNKTCDILARIVRCTTDS